MARKRLNPLLFFGSDYETTGLSAATSWKYELVVDYLKASSSYNAISRLINRGIDPNSLNKDGQSIAQVVKDFGPIYKIQELEWWQKYGMHLYGVKKPSQQLRALGELNAKTKTLTAKHQVDDYLVIEVPFSISITEATKQFRKLAAQYKFNSAAPAKLSPKYELLKTKLTQRTLQLGLEALRQYQKGLPLWAIGNSLMLNPNQCFNPKFEALEKYSYNKELLSIAASRLIKTATLVAENAARGRFPSNKPFKEAMPFKNARKAGRPTGTKRKKRS